MKWFNCVILLILTLKYAAGAETNKFRTLDEKIEVLKTLHAAEITRLKEDFEKFKRQMSGGLDAPAPVLGLAAAEELRAEIVEVRDAANDSATALRAQVDLAQQRIEQVLRESSALGEEARAQRDRGDRLEAEVGRLRTEAQQLRAGHNQLAAHLNKIAKQMKTKLMDESSVDSFNEVEEEAWERHAHRHRHQRALALAHHVTQLARDHQRLAQTQRDLQAQLADVLTRLEHFKQPDWNLLSAKLDLLELETKIIRDELKNDSQKMSDLDKLHASMLELREEVENIENKADKTMPEIRKEISKLDVNYAQLNAQYSYVKEDQENLRQSVKAIAVSVSNAVDRAESDRLAVHRLNRSVLELGAQARHHFYRLNDHILKSEANHDYNQTDFVPLPQLMGEVKELQPVESEYQDLVKQLPRDCSAVAGAAGVYLIRPGRAPLDAWCADRSTIVQRRLNGSVDFNRNFAEYVNGFGDARSELWLGLDAMHRLTADNCSAMRVDMTDIYGGAWYARYEHFYVGDAGSGYALEVGGFEGNASDAFEYQNHMEFSTIDRDRDISNTHCAGNYEGGWWFSHCQHVNINGKYTLGLTWFDSGRNEWIAVATSEVAVYRRPSCN